MKRVKIETLNCPMCGSSVPPLPPGASYMAYQCRSCRSYMLITPNGAGQTREQSAVFDKFVAGTSYIAPRWFRSPEVD